MNEQDTIRLMLYGIVDTFQVALKEDSSTSRTLRGEGKADLKVLGWKLPCRLESMVTHADMECCAAYVKIRKGLWAFVVSQPNDLHVYLLDSYTAVDSGGNKLGFTERCGQMTRKSVADTLQFLFPSVIAAFVYDLQERKWKVPHATPASDMDDGQHEQGAVEPEPCPAS